MAPSARAGLQRAKHYAIRTLERSGREVRRASGIAVGVPELGGVPFEDFLEIFTGQFVNSDPFVVQIGAHDGRSNDWFHDVIVRHGLSGILVEPQPHVFERLKKTYRGVDAELRLENVAISDHDGRQPFYVLRPDLEFLEYANQIASFDREHIRSVLDEHLKTSAPQSVKDEMDRRALSVDDCIEVQIVETVTFPTLLARHDLAAVDLLQIDAEGFDYEAIKLAQRAGLRPALIHYEHEHLSRADQESAWRDLTADGYQVFTHGGDTAAYRIVD